jgi:tripeptide aminopeptidase
MDLANFLMTNKQVKHGTIKILFTPDEEGPWHRKVDLKKLGADFGYTLDGGEAGSLEDETFSADGVQVIIHGVISHPGYAKGKMVNAMKIAGHILDALPKDRLSPESTEGKRGFIHPVRIDGVAEKCTVDFIIRDFDTAGLKKKEDFYKPWWLRRSELSKASYEFHVAEQYRNMKEILDLHPQVVENAKQLKEWGLREDRNIRKF